jgi:hypothetical protein
VFRAPRGAAPGLGSGQGAVYQRDRATQITSLGNTCAPVPRPVSHLHAAAAKEANNLSLDAYGTVQIVRVDLLKSSKKCKVC